jgi:hypothetical protein
VTCRELFPTTTVDRLNARVLSLRSSPRWGRLVSKQLTVITYTGQRTGRTFRVPVGYKRKGDIVTIGVRLPEAKTWWRNFLGEGNPISVELDGVGRAGHAVARRGETGRVTVTVRLHA